MFFHTDMETLIRPPVNETFKVMEKLSFIHYYLVVLTAWASPGDGATKCDQ